MAEWAGGQQRRYSHPSPRHRGPCSVRPNLQGVPRTCRACLVACTRYVGQLDENSPPRDLESEGFCRRPRSHVCASSINVWHHPSPHLTSQTLTRPIKQHEWKRFTYYASLIRTLHIDSGSTENMSWSPSVLTALCLHRNSEGTDLLPNLRNLRVSEYCWDKSANDQVAVLLGRSLKTIEISPENGGDDWAPALLGYLPSSCPDMESVNFRGCQTLPPNIIEDWPLWDGLRCFRCDAFVSIGSCLRLLKLPKLRDLSIGISQGEDGKSSPPLPLQIISHALTNLELRIKRAPCALKLLGRCNFPVLRNINLSVDDARLLATYITTLHDRCEPDLLRSFKILSEDQPSSGHSIPTHLISQLLRFKNLQEVDISTLPLLIDDTTLHDMATAWPQLAKLRMPHHEADPLAIPRITLVGLIPLAQQCPKLEELQISLNFAAPPRAIHNLPGHGLSDSQLQTIEVHGSDLRSSCTWVAGFLSGIFPKLKIITSKTHRNKWDRVTTALKVFNAVRKQERKAFTEHCRMDPDETT